MKLIKDYERFYIIKYHNLCLHEFFNEFLYLFILDAKWDFFNSPLFLKEFNLIYIYIIYIDIIIEIMYDKKMNKGEIFI